MGFMDKLRRKGADDNADLAAHAQDAGNMELGWADATMSGGGAHQIATYYPALHQVVVTTFVSMAGHPSKTETNRIDIPPQLTDPREIAKHASGVYPCPSLMNAINQRSSQHPVPFCPKCGGELRETDAFCPYCGAKVEQQPKPQATAAGICVQCGSRLTESARFCGKCGAPVPRG